MVNCFALVSCSKGDVILISNPCNIMSSSQLQWVKNATRERGIWRGVARCGVITFVDGNKVAADGVGKTKVKVGIKIINKK